MQKFYTIYDLDNQRIGLAGAKLAETNHKKNRNLIITYILLGIFVLATLKLIYNNYKERRASNTDYE